MYASLGQLQEMVSISCNCGSLDNHVSAVVSFPFQHGCSRYFARYIELVFLINYEKVDGKFNYTPTLNHIGS